LLVQDYHMKALLLMILNIMYMMIQRSAILILQAPQKISPKTNQMMIQISLKQARVLVHPEQKQMEVFHLREERLLGLIRSPQKKLQ